MRAVANSSEDLDNVGISSTSAPSLCKYATLGSTHHRLCKVSAIFSALVNVYIDFFGSDILVVRPQSHTPMYTRDSSRGKWRRILSGDKSLWRLPLLCTSFIMCSSAHASSVRTLRNRTS